MNTVISVTLIICITAIIICIVDGHNENKRVKNNKTIFHDMFKSKEEN